MTLARYKKLKQALLNGQIIKRTNSRLGEIRTDYIDDIDFYPRDNRGAGASRVWSAEVQVSSGDLQAVIDGDTFTIIG